MSSHARVSGRDRGTHYGRDSHYDRYDDYNWHRSQYSRDRDHRSHDYTRRYHDYSRHDYDKHGHSNSRRSPKRYHDDRFYSTTPSPHRSCSRSKARSPTISHTIYVYREKSPEGPPLPPSMDTAKAQQDLLISLAKKFLNEDKQEEPKQHTGFFVSLLQEYEEDKEVEDPVCDEIPQELADVLKQWWWTSPEKEDMKKLFKKVRRPANTDAIKQVWINTEVFELISQKGRETDQPYRHINNSLSKGVQPLATVWAQLIEAESILCDKKETDEDGNTILALPGRNTDKYLDISSMRKL